MFENGPFGFSQKTAMRPFLRSTSAITQPTNIETVESANYSVDPARKSFCGLSAGTPDLFGEIFAMPAAKLESIARSSETKARFSARSLSDRLTPSLISAGLVRGITPTSTRSECGAEIPDIASYGLDGTGPGQQKADLSSSRRTDAYVPRGERPTEGGA
mgnify:CR=1 FL=1